MIGNILNHGFEMPADDMDFPGWADTFVNTWLELFWDKEWQGCDDAIATLEREMIEARYSYIKEGMILKAFEYFKWYERKGFKTFKSYCEKWLKKPIFYAKKTIGAAQVAWGLLLEGFTELPDNVSQAQSLKSSARQVSEEADETVSCWSKVLETSKAEGKALTANYIEQTITGETTKPMATVKVPRGKWHKLSQKAKKLGKSTTELLEELIDSYVDDDKNLSPELEETELVDEEKAELLTEEKIKAWEKDHQALVAEHLQYINNNYGTTKNNPTIP
ncbi:MAG: hypothetical protein AAGJ08_01790 [Cyanobacteria bacterium P01_H01_bin.35]